MPSQGPQKQTSIPDKPVEHDISQGRGRSLRSIPVLQNQPVQKLDAAKKGEEPLERKFVTQFKNLEEEELPLQGKFTIQKEELEKEALPVKGKFKHLASTKVESPQTMPRFTSPEKVKTEARQPVQRFIPETPAVQKKENNTGLPDNLKEGVENLSGLAMDDVRVHYNSHRPARLNALAYAQGTDIHVGPGQEKQLPHEAWHVVQQKQGRVQPTMQMKVNIDNNINFQDTSALLGHISTLNSGSVAPIQLTRMGGAAGLLGGGLFGTAMALGMGILNPVGFAAMVGLPALASGFIGHKLTGPDEKKIPNLMHFVWLGGAVPEPRYKNIIQWCNAAKGLKVNLWMDKTARKSTGSSLDELTKAGVHIREISELEKRSERLGELRERLPTVDEQGVNGGAAGALSDVVRLEILSLEGGTYMDSDNTPGPAANSFSGMTAPNGYRLGWGELEGDENFSNDAISAAPGNRFINDYLNHSYKNLTPPDTIANIRSREKEKVKSSVMHSTGPHAMRTVPLPVGEERISSVRSELQSSKKLRDFSSLDPEDLESIDIGTFGRNREAKKQFPGNSTFTTAMENVFNDISFGKDMFVRASDNSWLR